MVLFCFHRCRRCQPFHSYLYVFTRSDADQCLFCMTLSDNARTLSLTLDFNERDMPRHNRHMILASVHNLQYKEEASISLADGKPKCEELRWTTTGRYSSKYQVKYHALFAPLTFVSQQAQKRYIAKTRLHWRINP